MIYAVGYTFQLHILYAVDFSSVLYIVCIGVLS